MWAELALWRLRRRARAAGALSRAAALWLGLVALAAALGGTLADHALALDAAAAAAPPGPAHPLGTDHLGRDVLARLVVGARAFVLPGLGALVTAYGLGVPAGLAAGWRGGATALALEQLTASVASLPRFVLVLLAMSVFGDTLAVLAVTSGVCYAPTLADELRARIEGLRADETLLASVAHGVPPLRLLGGHVLLGACADLLVAHAARLLAFVVVLETSLSYLGGFGVRQPAPSWGNMLAFDWGWAVHPVAGLAPVVALWATLAALATLARPSREGA